MQVSSSIQETSWKTGRYTFASKIGWRAGLEGVEKPSFARAFLGLSLVGLMHKSLQQTKTWIKKLLYLGTKTSSSSDSQSATARFFPPAAFTGEGVGGGVISILWKRSSDLEKAQEAKQCRHTHLHYLTQLESGCASFWQRHLSSEETLRSFCGDPDRCCFDGVRFLHHQYQQLPSHPG